MGGELYVRQQRAMTDAEIAFCERSIPAALDEALDRYADSLALDGEERATYGELAAGADRIAHGLQERLGADTEPVGLLFSSTRGYVEALLGVLKAGKIAMPLDSSAPRARLEACLADSGARLVLGDRSGALVRELLDPSTFDRAAAGVDGPHGDADSRSLLMHTSGSTGEPKGILRRHGSDLHGALMCADYLEIQPGSRFGVLFSLSFAAAQTHIFATLLSGATLLRYDVDTQSLSGLPRWIAEHEISVISGLSSLLRPLATASGSATLPSLKTLSIGAEPLAPSDAELACAMLPSGARFLQGYGATEAGVACRMVLDSSSVLDRSAVPVGPSLAGKLVRLVDVDDGVGEVVVTSRYLAYGYWRRDKETERAFFVDPVSRERSYRTGDFGRIDEQGRLIIVGRRDRMVKVSGKRVELDAVEHALLADERVAEAAVIARQRSSGANVVVGFVAPGTVDSRALKQHLASTLPPYMVPGRIVTLDALPRVPNGKVDRRALQETRTSAPTPPRNDLERSLVDIWEELLELPVGIDEDFFELGGDSLLAVELLVEIEERLSCSLSPGALLEARTVERLAGLIGGVPAAGHADARGTSPRLFLVYSLGGNGLRFRWLVARLGDEFPVHMLEAPWWDGDSRRIRMMEQLAAHHVAQIQQLQPAGPYLLVGNSAGGLVSLEVARQLAAAGHEIGLLAVLDTSIRAARDRSAPDDPRTWPLEVPKTAAHRIRRWLWMRWAVGRYHTALLRRRLVLARLRLRWWLDVHVHGAVPERRRAGYVAYRVLMACGAYRPARYSGRVTLFRARDELGPPDRGWHEVVNGSLEIHDVPCTHEEILLEPHVREFATKLPPLIREACSNGSAVAEPAGPKH